MTAIPMSFGSFMRFLLILDAVVPYEKTRLCYRYMWKNIVTYGPPRIARKCPPPLLLQYCISHLPGHASSICIKKIKRI